jgi:flagellar hook-basal body complex protein FliE
MPGPIAPALAAAAYASQAAPVGASAGAAGALPGTEGGFGAVLERAAQGALATGHAADNASSQALLGQGSVTDLVMAVSRAEVALQTTVAVRDRVIAAYQDVMRMPI